MAQVIIKAPEDANLIDNVEGNLSEQTEYNQKLQDIETNSMAKWADMTQVKQRLWTKLHSAKETMQQGVVNLAQLISDGANRLLGPFDESFVQLESESSEMQQRQESSSKMEKKQSKTQNNY